MHNKKVRKVRLLYSKRKAMEKYVMMDKIIQYQMGKINTSEMAKILDEYTESLPKIIDSAFLPSKDVAVDVGFNKATKSDYTLRKVLGIREHDIYYSGWMDCFDWITAKKMNDTIMENLIVKKDYNSPTIMSNDSLDRFVFYKTMDNIVRSAFVDVLFKIFNRQPSPKELQKCKIGGVPNLSFEYYFYYADEILGIIKLPFTSDDLSKNGKEGFSITFTPEPDFKEKIEKVKRIFV